ncbi:MAG: lysozyme inhibitor LprI family protein [Cytophagales bacterium]|nr:lysozyme inhibitor LprI family protein [Cytophagales bacterium]
MRFLTTLIFALYFLPAIGQENGCCTYSKRQLIGIWHGVRMTEEPFANVSSKYYIFTKNALIRFYLNNDVFYKRKYGFTKEKQWHSIQNEDVLLDEGKFYVEYNTENKYVSTPHSFELDSVGMEAFNVYYEKLHDVPYAVLERMVSQSKKDSHDYIREFLNKDIREVISEKALVYDQGYNKTEFHLEKGDLIEVLLIRDDYVHFKNAKSSQQGFIKYSEINKKAPIASFDCSKARTTIEKAICSSPELSSLDLKLNQVYKRVKKLKGNTVRDNQVKWIKRRNQLHEPNLVDKLIDIYKERINELEKH